jgi:Protein of unknown function (DUF3574)
MMHSNRRVAGIVAVLGLFGTEAWAQGNAQLAGDDARIERQFCEETLGGQLWSRTELYFGLSRSGAPNITDAEFQSFLDAVVTPRFPDGLTLLTGNGQFRGSNGIVAKEPSKLLILFYPWSLTRNRAIERIRSLYKRDFQQEAVLRVDNESCVSF